jgi:hypothetical protein
MTEIVENAQNANDYYLASLENNSLQLEPFCSCGNPLNANYYCEKCQRKCRCNLFLCSDSATLDLARQYIRKSSQFSGFKARLVKEN